MTQSEDALRSHLQGMAAPVLFVGAGLSRRYAQAEDWTGLLRRFADMTSQPYEYYSTSAGGSLPEVASRLAESFHELWWTDERFADSRFRVGHQNP